MVKLLCSAISSPRSQVSERRNAAGSWRTCRLRAATTVAVSFLDLGEWNFVVAILIAITKAMLVVWFFMHLNHASALTKLFAGAGFFWMLILVGLTLSDYLSRMWLPAI